MTRTKRHFRGNNKSADKQKRRERAEQWKSVRGDEATDRGYETPTVNERFESFYRAQGFITSDQDWEKFLAALRTELPACFRINPNYEFADDLRRQLHEFCGQNLNVDGVEVQTVQELEWYPDHWGYKLGTCRKNIRKLPGLKDLHQWLMQHTNNGNITRQEAVSMVPPLALDVQPHHKCLDMCAAPGSKTSQLLEVIDKSAHEVDESRQGLVIANDADTDRAYMLVHQCKRINSPLLIVTTHKGQLFPRITIPSTSEAATESSKSFINRDGYFDRVLCDVPCSGTPMQTHQHTMTILTLHQQKRF